MEESELRKTFILSSLSFWKLCRRGGGKNVTRKNRKKIFLRARHDCSHELRAAMDICVKNRPVKSQTRMEKWLVAEEALPPHD